MTKKRTFSAEQKLQILREADTEGMVATCRKYELSQGVYYRWKNQFDKAGIDGLQPKYKKNADPKQQKLEQENERLKKIIAKQALELEVKSELLKKNDHFNKSNE